MVGAFNQSLQCTQDVFVGFQAPLPPVSGHSCGYLAVLFHHGGEHHRSALGWYGEVGSSVWGEPTLGYWGSVDCCQDEAESLEQGEQGGTLGCRAAVVGESSQ